MKQTEYPQKHPRGSSPQREIRQEFDSWVKNLRSIEGTPDGPSAPPDGVEPRFDKKTDLHAQEPDTQKQPA
jgi:hypothetical protein